MNKIANQLKSEKASAEVALFVLVVVLFIMFLTGALIFENHKRSVAKEELIKIGFVTARTPAQGANVVCKDHNGIKQVINGSRSTDGVASVVCVDNHGANVYVANNKNGNPPTQYQVKLLREAKLYAF